MVQNQSSTTNQSALPVAPINPALIAQSESPTAVILAIAILISVLVGGITSLVRVVIVRRSLR